MEPSFDDETCLTTRTEQIQEQIKLAEDVLVKYGYTSMAVITATRLARNARKEYFGFHFAPKDSIQVGEILARDDGSIAKVEAII